MTYRLNRRVAVGVSVPLLLIAAIPGVDSSLRYGLSDPSATTAAYYTPLGIALPAILAMAYLAGNRVEVDQDGTHSYWYGSSRDDVIRWFFLRGGITLFVLAAGFFTMSAVACVGLADDIPSANAYGAARQCPAYATQVAHWPQWCILTATVDMYYSYSGPGTYGVSGTPSPRYVPLIGVGPATVDARYYKNVPIINELAIGDTFTATIEPDGTAASIAYRGDSATTPASPLIEDASYTELAVAMAMLGAFAAGAGVMVNSGRFWQIGKRSRSIRARLVALGLGGLTLYIAAVEQDRIGSSASPALAIAHSAQVRAYVYPACCLLLALIEVLRSRRYRPPGTPKRAFSLLAAPASVPDLPAPADEHPDAR